jgi:hypothetical protein
MAKYELSHIKGNTENIFTNNHESVQLIRLMAASNSLVAVHRYMEIAEKNPLGDGDLYEFSGDYLNSALLMVVGTLCEALSATRNLCCWFLKIEKRWKCENDSDNKPYIERGELPEGQREKLLMYACKDSKEWKLIEGLRNEVAFHWKHERIVEELVELSGENEVLSKIVSTNRGAIVHYDFASRIISKIGFTSEPDEMKERVLCIRKVMAEFLEVTSVYLPSYLAMSGCFQANPKKD